MSSAIILLLLFSIKKLGPACKYEGKTLFPIEEVLPIPNLIRGASGNHPRLTTPLRDIVDRPYRHIPHQQVAESARDFEDAFELSDHHFEGSRFCDESSVVLKYT